ncbi:MAG: RluA family pseudouridine synthase [Microthrixaceae bacterium]|nr:RluA family pseudouridine synthase [Microthrixaceae bacterium]
MAVHSEHVPEVLAGQRLDRVVAMITGLSRSEVAVLLVDGAVTVDGVVAAKGSVKLTEGALIQVDVAESDAQVTPQADPAVEVPVVFADEHVVVVDKPADLVVHPGAGHDHGTMVAGLLAHYPEMAEVGDPARPGIVHRLDRGTSGLLVVARTGLAYESLVGQLSQRTVERRYRALVWGHPESSRGLIDAPIGRSPRHPTRMAVVATGKEARTRYQVDQVFTEPAETALVTCRLETGRTHQIRVHLAAIGHRVVGDDRYQGVRESIDLHRPFLHAEHLAFDHPGTGERVGFDSPLAPDLRAVLESLAV